MSKCSAVLLILILVSSSFILSGLVCATTPKPSVPEFTLKYADYSHSVPPTYGIDPYTGKSIIVAQGREIVNRTVQFTIKNQPFTPQIDSDGNQASLYYHIRYKGHYENSWRGTSHELDGRTSFSDTLVFPASNTAYTEISVVRYFDGGSDYKPLNYVPLPDDGSMDFQVQAIIGAASLETLKTTWSDVGPFYVVTGQIGDWSSTQTITIGKNTTAPTPDVSSPSQSTSESPNPTPNQSSTQIVIQLGLDWLQVAVLALFGVIAILIVVFLHKRGVKK